MELKHIRLIIICKSHGLLIVPYGIETQMHGRALLNEALLIVPYGIETS